MTVTRVESVSTFETMAFSLEASPMWGGAIEMLLGGCLDPVHRMPLLKRVRAMGRQIDLKRAEQGKVLKCGPVRLLTNGMLRIEDRTITLGDVPESGVGVGGSVLLRSGPDVIALRTSKRLFCFSYEDGCWYYADFQLDEQ